MIGFEITHNGKRKLLAGNDRLMSLQAVLAAYGKLGKKSSAEAEAFGNLSVFGIAEAYEKKPQQMLTWEDEFRLEVGDEIKIRIVEIDSPQKPRKADDIPDAE